MATQDEGTFELRIDEQSQFAWKAVEQGREVSLSGNLLADAETLALESQTAGTMLARVHPVDSDSFQFVPAGAEPGDQGLTFHRKKE